MTKCFRKMRFYPYPGLWRPKWTPICYNRDNLTAETESWHIFAWEMIILKMFTTKIVCFFVLHRQITAFSYKMSKKSYKSSKMKISKFRKRSDVPKWNRKGTTFLDFWNFKFLKSVAFFWRTFFMKISQKSAKIGSNSNFLPRFRCVLHLYGILVKQTCKLSLLNNSKHYFYFLMPF